VVDTVINILHLLATAIWLGGAITIHFVLGPAYKTIDPTHAGRLQAVIGKRFSMFAWICILTLIITGYIKTPAPMLFDFRSETGLALGVKHILVLAILGVGLTIGLVAIPRMRKNAPSPGEAPSTGFLSAQKLVHDLAMVNTLLGVGTVICASLLW
jgi:uncharacterized membrane protein